MEYFADGIVCTAGGDLNPAASNDSSMDIHSDTHVMSPDVCLPPRTASMELAVKK
jgi:hypothetical protein